MAQVTFSIRMDENLKRQFDALCDDFGMNVTTAFTIFAKAVVREREIPFKISSSDPFYSGANLRHIMKGINAFESGQSGIEKTIDELEELADE